jgi:hypothetical protein
MQQVPAEVLEIVEGFRFFDGQGKIAAAFGRAIAAEHLTGL